MDEQPKAPPPEIAPTEPARAPESLSESAEAVVPQNEVPVSSPAADVAAVAAQEAPMFSAPDATESVPEAEKAGYPVLFIGVCALAVIASLGFAASRFLSPKLEVVSEPAGASVFVNGRLAGATPMALSGMSSGQYSVRIEKNGFQTVSKTLDLPATGAKIYEKLSASPAGSVRVDVKPRGAEVLLDGELMGTTPLYIPAVTAGVHELIIRRTNYKLIPRKF